MRVRVPGLLLLLPLLAAAPLRGQGAERLRAPGLPLRAVASADSASAYERRQAWLSRDKFYHFGVSAVGAGALYAGARRLGLSRWQAAAASTLLTGAAGVWREVGTTRRSDLLTRQKLSRRDLVWDAAGIAVGLAVADRWLGSGPRTAVEPPPAAVSPPPVPVH